MRGERRLPLHDALHAVDAARQILDRLRIDGDGRRPLDRLLDPRGELPQRRVEALRIGFDGLVELLADFAERGLEPSRVRRERLLPVDDPLHAVDAARQILNRLRVVRGGTVDRLLELLRKPAQRRVDGFDLRAVRRPIEPAADVAERRLEPLDLLRQEALFSTALRTPSMRRASSSIVLNSPAAPRSAAASTFAASAFMRGFDAGDFVRRRRGAFELLVQLADGGFEPLQLSARSQPAARPRRAPPRSGAPDPRSAGRRAKRRRAAEAPLRAAPSFPASVAIVAADCAPAAEARSIFSLMTCSAVTSAAEVRPLRALPLDRGADRLDAPGKLLQRTRVERRTPRGRFDPAAEFVDAALDRRQRRDRRCALDLALRIGERLHRRGDIGGRRRAGKPLDAGAEIDDLPLEPFDGRGVARKRRERRLNLVGLPADRLQRRRADGCVGQRFDPVGERAQIALQVSDRAAEVVLADGFRDLVQLRLYGRERRRVGADPADALDAFAEVIDGGGDADRLRRFAAKPPAPGKPLGHQPQRLGVLVAAGARFAPRPRARRDVVDSASVSLIRAAARHGESPGARGSWSCGAGDGRSAGFSCIRLVSD